MTTLLKSTTAIQSRATNLPFYKSKFFISSMNSSTYNIPGSLHNVIPVKSYINSDLNIPTVLLENKFKSGIYMWEHRKNGKIYLGSSTNLQKRFNQYYNSNFLLKYPRSHIYCALLKQGYAAFNLRNLEYCPIPDLIIKQQKSFDQLSPQYNILKFAGSSTGRMHSETSRELMRNSALDRKHSESTRLKIVEPALSQSKAVIVMNNLTGV